MFTTFGERETGLRTLVELYFLPDGDGLVIAIEKIWVKFPIFNCLKS
jgi:hypothetical protein